MRSRSPSPVPGGNLRSTRCATNPPANIGTLSSSGSLGAVTNNTGGTIDLTGGTASSLVNTDGGDRGQLHTQPEVDHRNHGRDLPAVFLQDHPFPGVSRPVDQIGEPLPQSEQREPPQAVARAVPAPIHSGQAEVAERAD